jgi:hypothetical protein
MLKVIWEWWVEWCVTHQEFMAEWFFPFMITFMICAFVVEFYIVVLHRPFKFLFRHLQAYMQSKSVPKATA